MNSAEREKAFEQLADQVADLELQGNLLRQVVKLVQPSVVHIDAEKTARSPDRYGRGSHVEEAGSGLIFAYQGQPYIATNRHVVKDAEYHNITIELADGRRFHPTTIWDDPPTDIAVIQIAATNLVTSRTGNSDQLDIGDFVLAVGSPFGLSRSVTFGIVSAKSRRDLELGEENVQFQDFIQTDAAINPGNSGGPLVNLRGEVVGINTAIASNSGGNDGIGFAIPMKMVVDISNQLIENNGKVVRAFLGVHLDRNFTPVEAAQFGLSHPYGARVTRITDDSPAAAAKLEKDDIIVGFNGVTIEDDGHLINTVGLTQIDEKVEIKVLRNGKSVILKAQVTVRRN
ncbi:MAG: serine protease [Planctomycetaceae bacterium]|nr:serine protease [Planctomycetaceae bacterium]